MFWRCTDFKKSGLTALRIDVSRFQGLWWFSLREAAFLSSSLEFFVDFSFSIVFTNESFKF